MTHQIVKRDNYLLLVDNESKIKDGDYSFYWNQILKVQIGVNYSVPEAHKKIIYHLPINNSPILERVPLLPPLEDEVDSWITNTIGNLKDEHTKKTAAISLKGGYNKAIEKYKYTDEDMRFAIKSAFMQGVERVPYLHQLEDNIIKSLQQPKYPIAFECEMEYKDMVGYWYKVDEITKEAVNRFDLETRPKTITNSQGLTQVVGKYIY